VADQGRRCGIEQARRRRTSVFRRDSRESDIDEGTATVAEGFGDQERGFETGERIGDCVATKDCTPRCACDETASDRGIVPKPTQFEYGWCVAWAVIRSQTCPGRGGLGTTRAGHG
jgi:hypothetical protein